MLIISVFFQETQEFFGRVFWALRHVGQIKEVCEIILMCVKLTATVNLT